MRLLPTEHFELDSPLPKDEVLRRLAELTWPERFFRDPTTPDPKPLEGRLVGDAFLVRRAHLGFRTRGAKLTAQADGVVAARPGGSRLTATLSHGWLAGFLLTLGLGVPLAVWALMLVAALVGAVPWAEAKAPVLAMPIVIAAMAAIVRVSFAVSARRVKAALRQVVGAPEPGAAEERSA